MVKQLYTSHKKQKQQQTNKIIRYADIKIGDTTQITT